MLEEPLIPKHSVGKTFLVASWLLGVMAALQVFAVTWAIARRIDFSDPGAELAGAALSDQPQSEAMQASPAELTEEELLIFGGDPGALAANSGKSLAEMVPAVEPEAGIDPMEAWPQQAAIREIRHPKALELMDAARILRERDDLAGALARLREAENFAPHHPRVLFELGSVLADMGLREQAAVKWKSILDLGIEQAGDFWVIADLNLRGDAGHEVPLADALLTVSSVLVERHVDVPDGEKVTLRIAVKARAGAEIVPGDVVVNVFFFDLVNGQDVARTTADQPRYQWATLPIDWVGQSVEILDVEYFHPVLSGEELRELGHRRYHGYILEVYYEDALQDVVAQPRTLRGIATDGINPLMINRLFPTN
ncbi:MAG: hypothetical protein ACC661_06500 [Verrucomicrobiales bacterium]